MSTCSKLDLPQKLSITNDLLTFYSHIVGYLEPISSFKKSTLRDYVSKYLNKIICCPYFPNSLDIQINVVFFS